VTNGSRWTIERHRGPAATFHGLDPSSLGRREVWVFDVETPALVMGSTQPESDADVEAVAAAGVELVRRRSGGGAVLLVPGEVVWVDVLVPRGDPLWTDDVGVAFHWLGDTWASALGAVGMRATVHKGRVIASRWSRSICFAGVGAGEVLVDGRKAVGLSQRRSRGVARFQCCVHTAFDPAAVVGMLRLEAAQAAVAELDRGVAVVPRRPGEIEAAFLAALPA
jgi:lipoate-protein ligase A